MRSGSFPASRRSACECHRPSAYPLARAVPIRHGPASRWHDPIDDWPVRADLPDGSVLFANNEEELMVIFREGKAAGLKGLDPHPNWGWPADWETLGRGTGE